MEKRNSRLRAQHDPFQRHVGSNQGAKKGRTWGGREGERKGKKASLPKICGPTGNTRTLLVTSRWMLRAYTGPARASPVYIVWYKNIALFSSLSGPQPPLSRLLLIPLLSAKSPRACDHHYAHPPSPVPWSSPFFVLLFSSSSAHNLLPSSFASHSTSRRRDILLPRELRIR